MRKSGQGFLVGLGAILALAGCAPKPTADSIQTFVHGSFLIILHGKLDRKIVPPILKKLDAEAPRMRADLGLAGEASCTIHIREDAWDYLDVMEKLIYGRYPGVTGYVVNARRMELLWSPETAQDALHEYAHCLSLLLNRGFMNKPRWLWESVAAWESGEFHDPTGLSYLVEGNYPSLAELGEDVGRDDRIYEVGWLLVEYVRRTWGGERIPALIKSGGDLEAALGIGAPAFEEGWRAWVESEYFGR
jgi:hypothetical protein